MEEMEEASSRGDNRRENGNGSLVDPLVAVVKRRLRTSLYETRRNCVRSERRLAEDSKRPKCKLVTDEKMRPLCCSKRWLRWGAGRRGVKNGIQDRHEARYSE